MLRGIIETNNEVILKKLVIDIEEDIMNDIMSSLKVATDSKAAPTRVKLAECECNTKEAHFEIVTFPEHGKCVLRIFGESLWDPGKQKYIPFEKEYEAKELLKILNEFEYLPSIDGAFRTVNATITGTERTDEAEIIMVAVSGMNGIDEIFVYREDVLETASVIDHILSSGEGEDTINIRCSMSAGNKNIEKGFIHANVKTDQVWIEIHGGPIPKTIKNMYIETDKLNDILKDIINDTRRKY